MPKRTSLSSDSDSGENDDDRASGVFLRLFEKGIEKGKSKGFESGYWKGSYKGAGYCDYDSLFLEAFSKGRMKGESKGYAKGFAAGFGKRSFKGKGWEETLSATSSTCPYFCDCSAHVHSLPADLQGCFDFENHSRCYCETCHWRRGDYFTYNRGGQTYALPIGWSRIALVAGGTQASLLGAFDWHVSFHATGQEALPSILGTGRLVRPGEATAAFSGSSVSIRTDTGRIHQPFWRWNEYTWDWEWFDPCQIFSSPSIRYCDLPSYSKQVPFVGPSGRRSMAKVALQLRLRPGSYSIGQATSGDGGPIDPYIGNHMIEWYSDGREHASHIITGLMVKLEYYD